MTASLSTVHVSHRGEDRLRRGHPWIYRSDVTRASAASGDLVTVIGPRERKLGEAMWSDRSQIAIRWARRSPLRWPTAWPATTA